MTISEKQRMIDFVRLNENRKETKRKNDMAKLRSTNIHLSTKVITYKRGAGYDGKKCLYEIDHITRVLRIESLCVDIWFRVYIDDKLVPAWCDDLEGYEDCPKGFDKRLRLEPKFGATIKIEAFRIGEGYHIQDHEKCLIGHCIGQFTPEGFILSEKNNVTTKEEKEINTKTKY